MNFDSEPNSNINNKSAIKPIENTADTNVNILINEIGSCFFYQNDKQ